MESSNQKIAQIVLPKKSVTQSGLKKSSVVVRFDSIDSSFKAPLTNIIGQKDSSSQMILRFATLQQAESYLQQKNIEYKILR